MTASRCYDPTHGEVRRVRGRYPFSASRAAILLKELRCARHRGEPTGSVLGKGQQERSDTERGSRCVLGLGRLSASERLRRRRRETTCVRVVRASTLVGDRVRRNSSGEERAPSMRPPIVRSAGSSLPWHASRQHAGLRAQGTVDERREERAGRAEGCRHPRDPRSLRARRIRFEHCAAIRNQRWDRPQDRPRGSLGARRWPARSETWPRSPTRGDQ